MEAAPGEVRGRPEGIELWRPRAGSGQLCQALSQPGGRTERCPLDLTAQRSLVILWQAVEEWGGGDSGNERSLGSYFKALQ